MRVETIDHFTILIFYFKAGTYLIDSFFIFFSRNLFALLFIFPYTDIVKMTNMTGETEYQFPETLIIARYGSLLVLFVGITCNTTAVVVLTRRSLRKTMSSAAVYLTVIVLADTLVLCVGLLPFWLTKAFDVEVRTHSSFCCKLFKFLTYFSTDFCNWIFVAMNVDRCIAILYPEKMKTFCSKETAIKTVIGDAVIMFIINFHLFFGVDLEISPKGKTCYAVNYFTIHIWNWVDFCLYFLIPFLLTTMTNVLIISTIVKSRRKVDAVASHSTSDNTYAKRSSRRLGELTRTMFVINVLFFLLTAPVVVYDQYESHMDPATATERTWASLALAEVVATILEFTNNSIHFFIYCLTIPKFRQELVNIFKFHNLRS